MAPHGGKIMIGWKVKCGYIENNNYIETDTDSLYSIMTVDIAPPVSAETVIYDNLSLLYDDLDNKFNGQQLQMWGPIFYGTPENRIVDLNLSFPSIRQGAPNLFDYVKGKNSVNVWVYFKSLKKYLTISGSRSSTTVNILDDNKSLLSTITFQSTHNVYSYTFANSPSSTEFEYVFSAIYNYDGEINFDSSYLICVNVDSPPYRPRVYYIPISQDKKGKSTFEALFGGSKPDFENNLPPDNPYEPGGPSGEGGGGGTFDDDSDIIGIPDLPTLSAANTGFTRIYNPTLSQVQDLARYLWTDETVIQTIWNHIKQFFENPMEAIIGFNLVPVPVPDGGTKNFALMYIDTGVQMTVAANQFVDVDCGTLEIKKYFGSALDYAPYTKISCYLPYIGVVTLNTDEVMGRTLQVVYRVDICSGSCVAYITVDGNAIYQYSGHCAINIPMSAADFSSYVNAAISVGKLAGTLALGASGIAGAAAVSEVTQTTGETTSRVVNTERNAATGRQITTGTQTVTKGPQEITTTKASYSGIPPANITNTAGEVISSKPHVEHSGSFSGNSGYLGVRRPFVIIQRPNMCMPENYQTLNGFPSMITMKLSECTGFTRVQQVQLTNMGQATNPEQAEIQQLLKMGVIF